MDPRGSETEVTVLRRGGDGVHVRSTTQPTSDHSEPPDAGPIGSVSPRQGFPGGSEGKESACSAGDLDSIPGSGRSLGEGNGNPLQNSCLENPMDRGAWWATVHGVTKSWT